MRIEFGEFGRVLQILVHLVTPLSRTEMRKARSGHNHMSGILVIDRREHAPLFQRPSKINRFADAPVGNELAK